MPADPVAWFALKADHGIDYAGNLEPIQEVGVSVAVPQIVAGSVIDSGSERLIIRAHPELTDNMPIRVIPGTRIVETSNEALASVILAAGTFDQIEKPTQKAISEAKSETAAHVDAMDKRAEAVRLGSEHPADVNDPNPAAPILAGGVSIPGTVSFRMTADDRLAIDQGIAAGEIKDDEAFAKWLTSTSITDVLADVGDDRIFALRAHVAESDRADSRKGLLDALAKILTTKTEG
jgi:hypothetical protein